MSGSGPTVFAFFDDMFKAQKCYDKGFNDPNSKYYKMEVNQIIESWEKKAAELKARKGEAGQSEKTNT